MSTILIYKLSETYCLIKADLSESNNFDLLSELPGFKKWQGRLLKFRPAYASIEYINDNWPLADWSDCQHLLDDFLAEQENKNIVSERKKKIISDDGQFEYKTKPLKHQAHAFMLSRDIKYFAFLDQMGTGKTKTLIDTFAWLYLKNKINCVVIIAPNGVHSNWINIEIPKHLPDWCKHEKDFYSRSHGKKRMESINRIISSNNLVIISINIESLRRKKGKSIEFLENLLSIKKCIVILDESSAIKRIGSNQTKNITKACKNVEYKRIANGSPITKGIEDLYSQFYFLDKNIIGYDTYTAFKSRYCKEIQIPLNKHDPNSKKFPKITGYKNIDELRKKIEPYSIRRLKKDCIDLPEKTYTLFAFELSKEQRRAYDELKEEFITEINGISIEENFAVVRLMRLQQIISGYYPSEDNNLLLPFPGENPRLESLKTICNTVNENGEKAIIWARFRQEIIDIESMLGKMAVGYHGSVPQAERATNVERFQHDPDVRYMVAMLSSNSSAVRGHTWTAASTSIYYSNIFDLDARLQSEDRPHRIGVGDKALYIDIMALGTMERKIIACLKNKKSISDLVTRDGPDGFLEFINE